jgi:hypothetical protein
VEQADAAAVAEDHQSAGVAVAVAAAAAAAAAVDNTVDQLLLRCEVDPSDRLGSRPRKLDGSQAEENQTALEGPSSTLDC